MTDKNPSQSARRLLIVAMFMAILWLILAALTYSLVVIPRLNAFDFYPRWIGSRAALMGQNPYTDVVTWQIQEGEFGRRLESWEDQQRFAYFHFIIWILLPFWLFPFPLSISLWSGLQFLILLLLPILVASILGWHIKPIKFALLLIFSILVYRYPVIAYLLGQFSIWCLAALIVGWWGLSRERPFIAGIAFLMALIRPEITFLPLLGLCFLAWKMKRRFLVFTFAGGVIAIWIITRLRIGTWEKPFIEGIRAYQEYSAPIWPIGLSNNIWVSFLLFIVVVGWEIWMWRSVRSLNIVERGGWVLALSTLVGVTIVPQTGNYSLVLCLMAVWMILWASDSWNTMWGIVSLSRSKFRILNQQ
jgi:hypothetical protein